MKIKPAFLLHVPALALVACEAHPDPDVRTGAIVRGLVGDPRGKTNSMYYRGY